MREPIPEILDAARLLDAAVTAHGLGQRSIAAALIQLANMPVVREWVESLWGKASAYNRPRYLAPAPVARSSRAHARMPRAEQQRRLLKRDAFHCRYCGNPVIRREVRKRMCLAYPELALWGRTNVTQHAAFQALWAQFDHVIPHAHGGTNDDDNIVIACAPCNFGRMHYTLAEAGLADPRLRAPSTTAWDGLERFH